MSDTCMTYEDWLRGCVHHDGRHGYVTLPCDEVLKIADFIESLRAERKTEPSDSGKPTNCEAKNYCDDCLYTDVCDSKEFFYACTTKATCSKMEQVDKDINVRSKDCETCKYKDHNWWSNKCDPCCRGDSHYEPKDEPQNEFDDKPYLYWDIDGYLDEVDEP